MSGYGCFAAYYDALTQNVDYARRGAVYREWLLRYGVSDGILLDLACGTGSLTVQLAGYGYDMIGVDASEEMLSVAQQKAAENGNSILFLCQPMQRLDLFGTVRGTVCALDSLNHLTKPSDVERTVERVSLFTEQGGLFLFDVNTVYKHRHILADNTFVLETEDVYCVWQNTPKRDNTVAVTLDFFEKDGDAYFRSTETFCERAYETDWLQSVLRKNDFSVLEIMDHDTMTAPRADTQRLLFVTQKKGSLHHGKEE